MPAKSKKNKELLRQEIPLLFLLLLLIFILTFSFFIVIKKYFILKTEYRKLYNSVNTVLVVTPLVNEIN